MLYVSARKLFHLPHFIIRVYYCFLRFPLPQKQCAKALAHRETGKEKESRTWVKGEKSQNEKETMAPISFKSTKKEKKKKRGIWRVSCGGETPLTCSYVRSTSPEGSEKSNGKKAAVWVFDVPK
ncbi:hypothetical protein OUZ56_001934 [Daphnia magna]|uniref:Uncharacterized protein n=1 Tax=Daphnia magna TaxID=35525 RepID=A0ABR0A468_9CRUS|nr:hypothetical protein OUZ56_001934 [Daphnia magna]